MREYETEIENTADILKKLVSQNGYDYVYESAYNVYKTLIKEKVDRDIANVMLYSLISGTARENKNDIKREIAKKLFLNSGMADVVSNIFSLLYEEKALSKMKEKEYKGLEEFLNGEWELTSEGEATWQYKGGSKTDYSYTYKITIHVSDKYKVKKELFYKLKKNPFLKAEDIRAYYEDKVDEIISGEFEEYCTSDDYYPPVVEDFDSTIDYVMEKFLPQHGLEMIGDEYDYDEGDIYW